LLVHNIRTDKTAYIYRRTDETGNLKTTGSTYTIGTNQICDISEERFYSRKADLIRVSNGILTVTYDGTNFGQGVLGDYYIAEVSNDWIPTECLKDVAYHLYQFCKNDLHLYTLKLGATSAIHLEPLDGITFMLSSNNLKKTGSGIIYSTNVSKYGNVELGVLA
jgi:hypothetical protein